MNELDSAKYVIKKIKENGFEAYFVGGFVRDYLMNIESSDIDITTSAKKSDLEKIFDKVIPTGEKFEGVTVIVDKYKFEVTTFRTDLFYTDHRHPVVEIARTLDEDLARRDFTINAIAANENFDIIDNYDGISDIKNKIIKAVGDPNKRFNEDALRILRAFYFSSKLNFDIEKETIKGINESSKYLENVSGERIYRELYKMFNTKYLLKGLNYLYNSNAINYLPSLKEASKLLIKYHHKVDFIEYLALGFYLEGFSNRYKLSSKETKDIKKIVELIDLPFNNFNIFSNDLRLLNYANDIKYLLNKNYIVDVDKVKNNLVIKDIKELNITANDIIKLGYKGPLIKEKLNHVINLVLDKKVLNEKECLIEKLKK